ncbi:biotin--[acetyl-CoA-carboxylase] ligase [Anaerotignum sp.]
MGTKEKLLSLFEEQKGTYFSGEEIAEKLSVSRTAVWKAVKNLRSEGYEIDAVPNKGYCLSVHTDILSAQGIQKYLNPTCGALELHVLPEVGSTNTLLREKANAGAAEGCTVIANAQTEGRGRMGRSFYSPTDTGIYMSLLLRPAAFTPVQAMGLTTMAAVAACEAIEEVSGKQAQIKWVNDIYMDGKKVSGILTEAALGLENGSLEYVVLGIGINVYPPKEGFPQEISQIAGAIFPERQNDGKNHLAAAFLNHFMEYYEGKKSADYVEKYRERSMVVGKEIYVRSPDGEKKAMALDVDQACYLLVRYEDGSIERLSSGEISIRF